MAAGSDTLQLADLGVQLFSSDVSEEITMKRTVSSEIRLESIRKSSNGIKGKAFALFCSVTRKLQLLKSRNPAKNKI